MSPAADPVMLADDALLSRGDNLESYDITLSAREGGNKTPRLAYIGGTLALARMGDTTIVFEFYNQA